MTSPEGEAEDKTSRSETEFIKVNKEGGQEFVCEQCGKGFKYAGYLAAHYKKMHGVGQPPKPKAKYVCNICGRDCLRRTTLEVHMRSHTGEMPFACGVCAQRFNSRTNMRSHNQRHARNMEENPLWVRCDACDLIFCSGNLLRMHIEAEHTQQHQGELSQGSEVTEVTAEVMEPQGTLCQYCERMFPTREALTSHMTSHQGEMPWECHFCCRRFKTRGNLVYHRKKHNEEARNVCPLCRKDCKKPSLLAKHMRQRHGEYDDMD